jgi:hypothetical protein
VVSYTILVYRNLLLHIVPDRFISTQNEVFKYGLLRNYVDPRWRPYKSAWWQVSWFVPHPIYVGDEIMRTQGEHSVGCMGKTINAHITLVKKPDGATPLRRIRYWWGESNEMALKQMGLGSVDWTDGLMVKSLRMQCWTFIFKTKRWSSLTKWL